MTKNDEKLVAGRAYSMTSIPDVMGYCDRYDTSPAIRTADSRTTFDSPKATLEKLLLNAAEDSLKALVTPVLVAWAQHWHVVGMPPADLAELLEFASSLNQTSDSYRLLVRQLLNVEVPKYEEPDPARCAVDVAQMPTVLAVVESPFGTAGRRQVLIEMLDGKRECRNLPNGMEALLVKQLDGSALLMFHQDGYVRPDTYFPMLLQVPADMVWQVNDVLAEGGYPFPIRRPEPIAADD